MAAILAVKRLAGVAPEVIFRECTCVPLLSANKAAHTDFELYASKAVRLIRKDFSVCFCCFISYRMWHLFPGPGPFTLFAPDGAAFKKIPAATLNQLLKDKTELQGEGLFKNIS